MHQSPTNFCGSLRFAPCAVVASSVAASTRINIRIDQSSQSHCWDRTRYPTRHDHTCQARRAALAPRAAAARVVQWTHLCLPKVTFAQASFFPETATIGSSKCFIGSDAEPLIGTGFDPRLA